MSPDPARIGWKGRGMKGGRPNGVNTLGDRFVRI